MRKTHVPIMLIAMIALASCTKNFSDINTNKLGIPYGGSSNSGSSTALQDASGYLPTMMQYIYPSNGAPGVCKLGISDTTEFQ
jgi:hypothetical protein